MIKEFLKKNQDNLHIKKLKKTSNNAHNISNGATHHQLASFDSLKQKRPETNVIHNTGSSIDNNILEIILKPE